MKDIKAPLNSFLILLILTLTACNGRRTVSYKEYVRYLNSDKSGLDQKKTVSDIQYEAQYLTPEAMTIMELKEDTRGKNFSKLLPEYNGLQYVRFSFKTLTDGHIYNAVRREDGDPEDIEAYLNLSAQKDFFMTSGTDTARCVLYSFAKTYGLAYDWQLMLGFEKKDSTQDLYLHYDDKVTGSGTMSFLYRRKDISNLPLIKLEP